MHISQTGFVNSRCYQRVLCVTIMSNSTYLRIEFKFGKEFSHFFHIESNIMKISMKKFHKMLKSAISGLL